MATITPFLTFYLTASPVYLNYQNKFQIGYTDTSGELTNVTVDAIVTVLESSAQIFDTAINGNAYKLLILNSTTSPVTVYLKITYLNITIYQSLALVADFPTVTAKNFLTSYKQLLPKFYNMSNNTYMGQENQSAMAMLYTFYDNSAISNAAFTDLNTIRNNLYPSSGGAGWEQFLTGSNYLLLNSYAYGKLLKLLYQIAISNNTNPFYYAQNISAYIYYRLGEQYYVYVDEYMTFAATGLFILTNNSLGQTVLNAGGSSNSSSLEFTVYILNSDESSLPAFSIEFQAELNNFIRNVTPSNLSVTVSYDYTIDDFITSNQFTYIADTYQGDPRQTGTICISFNEYQLDQALGYGGTANSTVVITDFDLTLSPTATINKDTDTQTITISGITASTTYQITVTPIYSTPPVDSILDNIINYTQFYSDNSDIVFTYNDSTIENVTIESGASGEYTGRIYLGLAYYNIIWSIT